MDRNDSYISVMARVVYSDNDIDFKEFWGLELTTLILISDKSVIQEERNAELS